MKLDNSGGSLEGLHKTFSGLNIKRFQFHIKIIGQRSIDLGEILLSNGGMKMSQSNVKRGMPS